MLTSKPGFTVVAGVGANTAIFSVINGVLLKPLPYREPEQLVRLFESSERQPRFPMSPANFQDYREQNSTLSALALYTRTDLELSLDDKPEKLAAMRVTGGFFDLLGFRPLLGREFRREEELADNSRVVILSHGLWQRRFGSDPDIVGKAIPFSGEPFTVIGVMPANVQHVGGDYRSLPHGEGVDVWWPIGLKPEVWRKLRGAHFVNAIGRVKPGVTLADAKADFNVIAERLAQQYPNSNDGWRIAIQPLHEEIVGRTRTTLLLLLAAVVFVLLIASVNVANLILVRATARERELALRQALGARSGRLVRQMLTESLLLALLGGAAGLVLARLALAALLALAPTQLPRLQTIGIDGRILAFALGVSMLTGVLFGLAPALQSLKLNVNELLKDGGRTASGGVARRRLRDALVVAEVALALVLLIGAGLLLRSFSRLQQTDAGFNPGRVLTANLTLPAARYKEPKQVARLYQSLLERLTALQGVRTAGLSSDLPWTGYDENSGFDIEGKTSQPGQEPSGRYHFVSADYFRSIETPLLAGRFFNSADSSEAPQVIIINQSLAQTYWPGETAVGKRITFMDQPKDKDWLTVVGVVGDVKDFPHSLDAKPAFYWPVSQRPFRDMSLAVRTEGDPLTLVAAVRDELRNLDKDLPLADVRTLDTIAAEAAGGRRFTLLLTGLFALTALALAAVGIYGVMAYSVTQRTHELGIRMALGAKQSDVLGMVIRQGMKLALVGLAIGLAGAWLATRAMTSLLFGVSATDPATFAVISVVLAGVALGACFVPARRATKVDPMIALRYE